MTAAIQVLRIQFRMLGYPFLAMILLVAGVSVVDETTDFGSAAQFLSLILTFILAAFSGPIVFGFEYSEGARDYLATRPYPAWKHYQLKVVALAICNLAIVILVFLGLEGFGDSIPPLLLVPTYWAGLMTISLWCSIVTILTRDIVRGILYGTVTIVVFCYLGGWFWYKVLFRWIMGIPNVDVGIWGPSLYNLSYSPYYLLPFLLNAILATTYKGVYIKKAFFPWHLAVVGAITLSYCGFVLNLVKNDASLEFSETVLANADNPKSFVLGYGVQEDKLRYVQTVPSMRAFQVFELEFKKSDSTPHLHSMISLPGTLPPTFPVAYFEGDKLHLVGGGVDRSWTLSNSGTADLDEKSSDRNRSYLNRYFARSNSGDQIIVADRIYALEQDPGQPCGWIVKIYPAETRSGRNALGKIPVLGNMVFDKDLTAGFSLNQIRGENPWSFRADQYVVQGFGYPAPAIDLKNGFRSAYWQELVVVDASDPGSPHEVTLEIPIKLYLPRQILQAVFDPSNRYYVQPPSLSLGGGYLFAWFSHTGRGAAWDVKDPGHPRYLGSFPLPLGWAPPIDDYNLTCKGHNDSGRPSSEVIPSMMGPTMPLLRDDGALGFVSPHYGPFWIKFPELAKEVKS